jgi:hypothetical protein
VSKEGKLTMLILLFNLILLWCLVMLYVALRPDHVEAFVRYIAQLEVDLTESYIKLGSEVHRQRYSASELAALQRRARILRLRLRALIVFLAFLKFPFALFRFFLSLFWRKS